MLSAISSKRNLVCRCFNKNTNQIMIECSKWINQTRSLFSFKNGIPNNIKELYVCHCLWFYDKKQQAQSQANAQSRPHFEQPKWFYSRTVLIQKLSTNHRSSQNMVIKKPMETKTSTPNRWKQKIKQIQKTNKRNLLQSAIS